jgi:hypothetical protein
MIRIFKPLAEPWSLGVPPCFGVKSYIDAHSVNGYMKKAEALGTSAQTTFKNKVTFFALSESQLISRSQLTAYVPLFFRETLFDHRFNRLSVGIAGADFDQPHVAFAVDHNGMRNSGHTIFGPHFTLLRRYK